MHEYTTTEIEFVKENFVKYGAKYCSEVLGRKIDSIHYWATLNGLVRVGREKHPTMQNVNPQHFWNIQMPEVAYFLGFFWADGYIRCQKRKPDGCYHKIAMEIVTEDAQDIAIHLDKIGKWSKVERKRKETWRPTTTINTNSKDIFEFLETHDYSNKSNQEPTKILSKIPESLKHYFWRGFFDGDGGVNFKTDRSRVNSIQFSGVIGYKFEELNLICSQLGFRVDTVYHTTHKTKNHSSAKFNMYRRHDIARFSDYLLSSEIGLTRKTEQLILAKNITWKQINDNPKLIHGLLKSDR